MSITIEQRLREMELVSDMLMVAMAEDDGESDEVKEEYGRKVDEKLADLREQLEEARRKEDKPLIGSPAGLPTPRDTTDVPERRDQVAESDDLDGKRAEELLSTLTSSQEQASIARTFLAHHSVLTNKAGYNAGSRDRISPDQDGSIQ